MNDLTVETGTPFWDTLDDRGSLPALIVDDGPVTYADLAQLADHWAARFRDEWTTSSPDHSQRQLLIAIEIAEDIPVIAAYLGALRAGHTVLLVESLDASLMIRDVFKPNLLVSSHGEGWNAQVLNAEPLDLHPDLRLLLVRSQGFWDRWAPELREDLAYLVHMIMRRICGEASAGFRWSLV